ncbi:MAG: UDP-N-acetylmuramate:L-alanyl-gamma-D-glutamyl-meso-diaminopimelate ligase, partial [Rhodothermales bacterium]|nr:UDP-N-acetylmuramate:L-alanyl-gamma-D-glutamyl-meso-diaminopimelate ligase [Rhodothermales bacterium]
VTSMEFDHADIYDSWEDYREAFRLFAASIGSGGQLVLNADDPEVKALGHWCTGTVTTYGLGEDAQIRATGIEPIDGGQRFDLMAWGEDLGRFTLSFSGRHNLLNTLAILAVSLGEGVSVDALRDGLQTFAGIKRRQEVRGEADGVIVVDDFAHHPTAVHATLQATRERWPDRRVISVFEPRSNSSRRKVFQQGYQEAFAESDALFISVPPFRHNDRISDFMDVEALVRTVDAGGVPAHLASSPEELLPKIEAHVRPGDVAVIMSNGGFGGIHDKLLAALRARDTVNQT